MPNPPHTVLKPTDAMIEAGVDEYRHWLKGCSPRDPADLAERIFERMEAARPEPQQDVVELAKRLVFVARNRKHQEAAAEIADAIQALLKLKGECGNG